MREEIRAIIMAYWSLDDGDARNRLADDLAEWAEEKLGALDVMLAEAQTIRIQQVQATAGWEQQYKDIADAAWKRLNDAHRQATEGGQD